MAGLLLLLVPLARAADGLEELELNIPGEPGVDYPIYSSAPLTGFSCSDRTNGYYADTLSGCQVFHYCGYSSSVFGSIKYTTLCPNGTIFNQETLICDWWYKLDCSLAESFYGINDNIEAFSGYNELPEKPFLSPLDPRLESQRLSPKEPINRKNGGSYSRSQSSERVFPDRILQRHRKKFPNFDIVTSKRKSRSDDGLEVLSNFVEDVSYGLAGKEDLEGEDDSLKPSWSRRGKRTESKDEKERLLEELLKEPKQESRGATWVYGDKTRARKNLRFVD